MLDIQIPEYSDPKLFVLLL